MKKFIPKEKLSKKAKRERNLAMRKSWGDLNPATRKAESKKAYKRQKPSYRYNGDGTGGFLNFTIGLE